MEMKKENIILVLNLLNHMNCGEKTLQLIIAQYAQAYGPVALLRNAYCSYSTPEYQAINSSVMYATPTIDPVIIITIFINSICCSVIYCSILHTFLIIISKVCTIAKPEKIAPATKYGGKIVVCHPGMTDVAKSKETIV